jgi:putative Holliday junction resolvase
MITTSAAELRSALPDGGALMGLDPGTKTIGVALCDRDWRFATAGQTIRRRKFAADKAELAALITARQVKGLVIGLPLHMDGSESPRSQAARAMARIRGPSRSRVTSALASPCTSATASAPPARSSAA